MATILTNRQKEVLDFICHTIEAQGYPPSQREIADHFQMVGILGVQRHLLALEKKGYVRRGKELLSNLVYELFIKRRPDLIY